MKRKLLSFLLPVLACPALSHAQLSLTDAISRVISEEPTRLLRLRGELLANNPEVVDYESLLQLTGSDRCYVSVFNTPGDTTACWKAEYPDLEDFPAAKKAFRGLYESLRTARITRLHPGTVYRLSGDFLEADETKQTNSIEFTLDPAGEDFQKIRVQILLTYVMPEWHLSVQVYEKPGELGMMSTR